MLFTSDVELNLSCILVDSKNISFEFPPRVAIQFDQFISLILP